MSASMHSSSLYLDLMGGAREAMCRAMSYIASQGGPRVDGSTQDLANLEAHRGSMLTWLQAQPDFSTLASGYLRHCEQWSPIFKD